MGLSIVLKMNVVLYNRRTMPLMSLTVDLKATRFSVNKSKTCFSWSRVKWLASITGKVSFGPKNAYFKVLGRGFNSRKEDEGALGRDSLD